MARKAPDGFTFGCDPELFIVNTKTGEFVSADGIIPGTKHEPHKVNFGAVQVDGMAAEFNIDPVDNFHDFDHHIRAVMEQMRLFLPTNHDFAIIPSVNFTQETMDKASEDAKVLGCDPDFDAWTGNVNPVPDTSKTPNLRTASGHLHIGWTEDADITDDEHLGHCRDLVKQMDWFLGAWSLRLDPDVVRRDLYGKAGAFRPKPYGVEYRVLSNFWLTTAERRVAVWDRMIAAITEMKRYNMPDLRSDDNGLIVKYINSGDKSSVPKSSRYPLTTLQQAYIPWEIQEKVKTFLNAA